MNIYTQFKILCLKYNVDGKNSKTLWNLIKPICLHPEFKKRNYSPFWHHDATTLGEHIMSDAIVTYKMIYKIKNRRKLDFINLKIAIYIAMFHDLYEEPWQNNIKSKGKKFKNLHGFTHPIEAVVNAITWFPNIFQDEEESLMIIDGIIHHMYPLPVRAIDEYAMELNNQEKFNQLPEIYKKMIFVSTYVGKVGAFSFRKSFYIEGRIMSKADKLVAIRKEICSAGAYLSLITGKNKKLLTKKED